MKKKFIHDKLIVCLMMIAFILTSFMIIVGEQDDVHVDSQTDETDQSYQYEIVTQYTGPEEGTGERDMKMQWTAFPFPYTEGNLILKDYYYIVGGTFTGYYFDVILQYTEPVPYSLKEGRFPTVEEINDKKLEAVIGENLLGYTEQVDNQYYLRISDSTYLVTGVMDGNMSDQVVLFYGGTDAVTQQQINKYLLDGYLNYNLLYGSNTPIAQDAGRQILNWQAQFADDIGTLELQDVQDEQESVSEDDVVSQMINRMKGYMVKVLYAFGLISCYAVSKVWTTRRRKECMIRKALGEDLFSILTQWFIKIVLMEGGSLLIVVAGVSVWWALAGTLSAFSFDSLGRIALQLMIVIVITMLRPARAMIEMNPAEGLRDL